MCTFVQEVPFVDVQASARLVTVRKDVPLEVMADSNHEGLNVLAVQVVPFRDVTMPPGVLVVA